MKRPNLDELKKLDLEWVDEARHSINEACYYIEELEAKLKVATEALENLSNESKGFLSMANRHDHGNTNMQCLQFSIDLAKTALKEIQRDRDE